VTNRDLQAEVAANRFREDLYFRLAVIPIHLPPLRERREDVLPLAQHFLAKWNADLARNLSGWTPEVESYLLRHAWPGNVRELENTIERGVVLARGARITLDDLLLPSELATSPDQEPYAAASLQDFLDHAAADRIRAILKETNGIRGEAARRLSVDRTTRYRLMRRYRIAENDQ
jgi:DNA-binding NtrC family response regulator